MAAEHQRHADQAVARSSFLGPLARHRVREAESFVMRRSNDKNRDIKLRGQFIPAFVETRRTPAWKAMSMGARELYITLKGHHFVGVKNNNGRIFLSERKATEEMGVSNRESIRRWYRELQHYGFIVMTNPGSLGVGGKGKA